MCLTFNQASEGFLLAVYSAFMPKFLESQFGAKASDAAFFVGIIVGEGPLLVCEVILKLLFNGSSSCTFI